jgi:hypothetical protein
MQRQRRLLASFESREMFTVAGKLASTKVDNSIKRYSRHSCESDIDVSAPHTLSRDHARKCGLRSCSSQRRTQRCRRR